MTFADDLEAGAQRVECEEKCVSGLRQLQCRSCDDEDKVRDEKWLEEEEDPCAGWGTQDENGVWHPDPAKPSTQGHVQEPVKAARKAKRNGRRRVD